MRKTFVALTLVVLCGCAHSLRAATVMKWLLGPQITVLSTQLNSLTNDSNTVASATINNTVGGGTGDGYTHCDIEAKLTFGANPTPNSGISVWLLMTSDGVNYEDTPTASIILGRVPDVVLPVTAGQTSTRVIQRIVCPWGNFIVVAQNTGTGQTLGATANTIKIRFVTAEGV